MINAFAELLSRNNFKDGFHKINVLLRRNRMDSNLRMFSAGKSMSRQEHSGNRVSKFERQVPTLIYIQNPINWLVNKIDFKMLRSAWDPDFDEREFKRGSIQAVSVICTLISKNLWDSLRGLLIRQALTRLRKDVELNWNDEQKRNISIEPSDVKLALPRKVHFLRVSEKKFVDVDMMFIAMKFKELEQSLKNDLLLIELVARFHRNYSAGEIPNWTVTLFKVTRFNGAISNRSS